MSGEFKYCCGKKISCQDSRAVEGSTMAWRRRYQCATCGRKMSTVEMEATGGKMGGNTLISRRIKALDGRPVLTAGQVTALRLMIAEFQTLLRNEP